MEGEVEKMKREREILVETNKKMILFMVEIEEKGEELKNFK